MTNIFIVSITVLIMLIPILLSYHFINTLFEKINTVILTLYQTQANKYKYIPYDKDDNIPENQHLTQIINTIITGLKENREQITLSQRSLAWLDITRTIKHEINNPLTPIQISISLIEKKFSSQIKTNNKLFTEYINIINHNIQHISKTLNHYSNNNIDNVLKLEKSNILDIINRIIKNQKTLNPIIKFSITCNTPNTIIYCNPTQMTQVFINIIKNAIKALSNQTNPSFHIRLYDNNNTLAIIFQDNGPGFTDLNMTSHTEQSASERINKGIGIGIATSYKIILNHDGNMSIQNHYFNNTVRGAKIKIILPIQKLYKKYIIQKNKTLEEDYKIG
ncbi:MAG: ATP-binding protein [Pseudomonadota bacterium]